MADEDAADRASQEIKALLRRLDPKDSSHKDRIRRLNKFRNFVTGESGGGTPEFYDDDIPLLLLGSAAPTALLGDHADLFEDNANQIYGLLQACGTPSVEHDHMLKRSARHAMNLLKFLVCDFVEDGQSAGELNLFAQGFCSFPVDKYRYMSLDLHLIGDQRGGAKEDACSVMVLLLTKHMAEDGETPSPLAKEDLLASQQAHKAFDLWVQQHATKQQRDLIKTNAEKRKEEMAKRDDTLGGGGDGLSNDEDDLDGSDKDEADGYDEDDALAGLKRRKKTAKKEMLEATQAGELEEINGPAMRWEDSQLYREQRARFAAHQRMQEGGEYHDTVRDSQEAAAEMAEREEEKSKLLRRDPLGLKDADFDLRMLETNQVDFLEQALLELQEELRKAEAGGEDDQALRAKKESLEMILDSIVGVAGADAHLANTGKSILPTNPNFDPILFLTLVHRRATYEELVSSMNRLSTDTQNQVKQLQDMVRENFALFLRCADGIDTFNEKTISQSGPGLVDRLNRLDALAESCAHQAKKSFKPLLDNANEVRKVQSALAVLRRVEAVLQAPYLMRQHVENGRFSAALKAYRRVQVIDDSCNIEILIHVKNQAAECAREARRELEGRLAQEGITVSGLLDSIRDLGELLEFDIPNDPKEAEKVAGSRYRAASMKAVGTFVIGGTTINVREYPPALACLLLQAAHFTFLVNSAIEEADNTTQRIFEGESLSSQGKLDSDLKSGVGDDKKQPGGNNNQWKYDVLEARSLATIKAVEIVSKWLPRLLEVAIAAREDEKRRAARASARGTSGKDIQLTPFEVFLSSISPSVSKLIEHAAFCGLGSAPRGSGMEIKMSFGKKSPEKLRVLLKSPLPPSQSSRVGKELAAMVEVLGQSSITLNQLKPLPGEPTRGNIYTMSPLDEIRTLGEQSVMTIERRRCIYAFDICARGCSSRATGSGKFDADALLACLRTLSDELTRPELCASEVEKGCELVIRKCCDGLASYVRDRGDSSRLSAVAECADVLQDRMTDVVREIGYLTNNAEAVEEVMMEDIMGLEGAMFDEFLESIRSSATSCCRMGWLDQKTDLSKEISNDSPVIGFPPYLSASLLAIVRVRAQVEQTLGLKIRRSEGQSYQHIAMATVAEGVAEGICEQIQQRKMTLKVRQADRLANEMQFLLNTLRNYIQPESRSLLEQTRRMLCSKAGRGAGIQGDGPDGLAALEELERLGRVYVLCLGQ
ncbi:exocyst complex component Sec5 [Nitzschia inconspicua]|uniref:Exocyst complex component Sec5 n=1 Tax=Nitzschia inconspicua TaxID=303405 RepID=A0A9K3LXN0_9STRA|nr:exocyst complex component Sec5 [Nitzschia inconspicua]